jgi:hypothetical protein
MQENQGNIVCQCVLPYLLDIKPYYVMTIFRTVSTQIEYISDLLLRRHGCIPVDANELIAVICSDEDMTVTGRINVILHLDYLKDMDCIEHVMKLLSLTEYDPTEVLNIMPNLASDIIDKLNDIFYINDRPLDAFARLINKAGYYNRILNMAMKQGTYRNHLKSRLVQLAFIIDPVRTLDFLDIRYSDRDEVIRLYFDDKFADSRMVDQLTPTRCNYRDNRRLQEPSRS